MNKFRNRLNKNTCDEQTSLTLKELLIFKKIANLTEISFIIVLRRFFITYFKASNEILHNKIIADVFLQFLNNSSILTITQISFSVI